MRLKNKNAIVTGAAGGFGQAIVQTFFREGANKVALVDIKENLLTDIISHLSNEGFQAFAYIADVSNEKDVEKISTQITEKFHKIDILVNNAGIAQSLPIQDVPVKDWERTIDINLKSAFLFSKMFAEHMIRNKYGKIINIASIAGQTGRPVSVQYAASKAGIIGLTRNLAYQLANQGINVNVVAPGPIITPMLEKSFTKETSDRLKATIPFIRQGTPQDIANAVLFLSSEEGSWITGQVLAVNGGAFMG
jgi:NAD(P)-dependent dehydrogenase (short-subunit alcohol dehydrogenase family)